MFNDIKKDLITMRWSYWGVFYGILCSTIGSNGPDACIAVNITFVIATIILIIIGQVSSYDWIGIIYQKLYDSKHYNVFLLKYVYEIFKERFSTFILSVETIMFVRRATEGDGAVEKYNRPLSQFFMFFISNRRQTKRSRKINRFFLNTSARLRWLDASIRLGLN